MSVRDRIADFGGSRSSSTLGKGVKGAQGASTPPSWAKKTTASSASPTVSLCSAELVKKPAPSLGASSGSARKLNVPDVFSNTTKQANAPDTSLSRGSSTSSTVTSKTSGAGVEEKPPTTENTAPPLEQLNGKIFSQTSNKSTPVGKLTENCPTAPGHSDGNVPSGSSKDRVSSSMSTPREGGELGVRSSSSLGPRSSKSLETSHGPVKGTSSGPKRDLLGLSTAGSSGGASEISIDQGRPRKTGQAGPRKLQVAGKGKAVISAEKQRAALGLDKDKDKDKDKNKDPVKTKAKTGGASNHPKVTARAFDGVPVSNAPVRSSVSADFSSPPSAAYSRPACSRPNPVPKSMTSVAVTGKKTGSSFPSASGLRSSGHNLW